MGLTLSGLFFPRRRHGVADRGDGVEAAQPQHQHFHLGEEHQYYCCM